MSNTSKKKEVGIVQPFDHTDLISGNRIRIILSEGYTKLMVNEREYYFIRETGEFDGTGSAVNVHNRI